MAVVSYRFQLRNKVAHVRNPLLGNLLPQVRTSLEHSFEFFFIKRRQHRCQIVKTQRNLCIDPSSVAEDPLLLLYVLLQILLLLFHLLRLILIVIFRMFSPIHSKGVSMRVHSHGALEAISDLGTPEHGVI